MLQLPDQNISRRGAIRTTPMRVISVGICRTGTLSMREAFRHLGYPNPYHFCSVLANVQDADIWAPILRAKLREPEKLIPREELDQVLGHCGAVTDTPCAVLWRDLVAAYPEAKVVLVERDEERWLKSISTLLEGFLNPLVYVLMYTEPHWFGRIFDLGFLWAKIWFGTTSLSGAKRNAIPCYRKHNAAIRAAVPKERLLVYELGSGWEPLCKFLGKEVPKDVDFPHVNEAEVLQSAFEVVFTKAIKRSARNVSVIVAVAAVVAGGVWKYWR